MGINFASFKISGVTKDIALVGLVTLMSIGANLPESFMAVLGINQTYLLIGLVAVIAVSLVRYLKFTLVLVIAILALGANLPNDLAREIGVDPQIMLFALVAMVGTSLVNFIIKLPKGVKPIAQINSSHGSRTLCHAAAKGHASMVYSLISAGINPNFQDEKGQLPLVVAAANGQALVVKLLLDNGADIAGQDGSGMTSIEAANKAGFSQTALLLKNAELKAAGRTTVRSPSPVAA
ncbi:MAG TPA: ankyrin repeat domain-containing protein [Acidiferrobacterales bacterium]|nr:ankyrin repeat domain-containing protein [Acidiferrobacterales bacterium]